MAKNFKNVKNSVAVATKKDILENDGNLHIPLYVEKESTIKSLSLNEATQQLKDSLEEVWESEDELKKLLKEFSLIKK